MTEKNTNRNIGKIENEIEKSRKELCGGYKICYYYAKEMTTNTRTICLKGKEECRYRHPRLCKNNSCDGEKRCQKVHIEQIDIEKYAKTGAIPYKMRKTMNIDCRYLKEEGRCSYGNICTYRHKEAIIVGEEYIVENNNRDKQKEDRKKDKKINIKDKIKDNYSTESKDRKNDIEEKSEEKNMINKDNKNTNSNIERKDKKEEKNENEEKENKKQDKKENKTQVLRLKGGEHTGRKNTNKKINFVSWNANGLNEGKYQEIVQLIKEKDAIVCIQETHHQGKILNLNEGIAGLCVTRGGKGKKGGGLQMLFKKDKDINLRNMKNTNKEILEAEGKIYGIGIKIVVVYFDSDRGEDGKEANKRIKRDIQRIIENNEQEGLIIAGDFNGHLRMIDGRKDDENGKMIIGWGEEYGLITLNLEEKCEGTYTRIVKEQKTTVDYILVNKKIYDIVEEIEIDENRDILEGSDHVAMRMSLRVKETRGFQKPKWKKENMYQIKRKI